MIALDSSALIAILQMEPDAKELASVLVDARIKIMSAVTLLETSMALARAKGDDLIWGPLDALLEESEVEIVAFDHEQANAAREAFMRFGKGRHPAGLNFGDCAAYALAKTKKAPLLFKGSDFAKTDIVPALR
jgi:ribonuclease VapC